MLSVKNITIYIFGIIILFPLVICLKCYVCDQKNDDDCRSNVKEHMIRTCEKKPYGYNGTLQDATGCSTLISLFRTQQYPTAPRRITRACFYRQINGEVLGKEGCTLMPDEEATYVAHNCTVCEEDLCNSSSMIQSSKTIITLLTVLIAYYYAY